MGEGPAEPGTEGSFVSKTSEAASSFLDASYANSESKKKTNVDVGERRGSRESLSRRRRPSLSSFSPFQAPTTLTAEQIEYNKSLLAMSQYDSYKFDHEDSKVHFEIRVLLSRSRLFQFRQKTTFYLLTIAIGVARTCCTYVCAASHDQCTRPVCY